MSTHQYERSVIEQVFCIDIHSRVDHLLTHFQVTPSAGLAQPAKILAIVKRVIFFESAILDQLLFFM
jgi:hypothetical protein